MGADTNKLSKLTIEQAVYFASIDRCIITQRDYDSPERIALVNRLIGEGRFVVAQDWEHDDDGCVRYILGVCQQDRYA